jgi:hypothetical protein
VFGGVSLSLIKLSVSLKKKAGKKKKNTYIGPKLKILQSRRSEI